MSRILITGGAGFLGGLATDILINHGHDVTVFDKLLYEERFLKHVPFIFGDICDTDYLVSIAKNYDYVIWMAALVGDPACAVNPEATNRINHIAVRDFCEKKSDNTKLIFMSTCSVYGQNDDLLNEESETAPLSAYASTKLAAEHYVLEVGGTVFRLGTVFGLGDTYSRLRLDLVVNIMTMNAFLDKKLVVNGGDQWRPIIAVADIAEYLVRAVESFHSGVYILSYKNVLIKDLGREVASLIPYTKIEFAEMPFQDLRNYRVDGSKAEKTFGYKCQVSVAEEVKKIYDLLNEHRVKDLSNEIYHNGKYLKTQLS